MNHNNIVPQKPIEPDESHLTTLPEEQSSTLEQDNCKNPATPSFRPKAIPWPYIIIAMLTVLLIMTSLQVSQQKEYGAVIAKEAYVISVSINLMEDTLMFKYGVLPEDIGLDDLRSRWIDTPCHETAEAYYTALKSALDYFKHGQSPEEMLTPLKV